MKGGHLDSGEKRKSGDGNSGMRRAANGAFWVRMGGARKLQRIVATARRGRTQHSAARIDAMCPLSSAG